MRPALDASVSPTTLGILCLETAPDRFERSLAHPDTFHCTVLNETVRGVWADDILDSAPGITGAFVDAAKALESRGATALISNCGYMVAYKKAIEEQVSIPVAVSSLLLLPQLHGLLSPNRKIGLLTFDAVKLTKEHIRAAWPTMDEQALAIADLRGTRSWEDWRRKDPAYDWDTAFEDVHAAVQGLLDREPTVQFLLLECTVLSGFAPSLKERFGLPVFDVVTLAQTLLQASDPQS